MSPTAEHHQAALYHYFHNKEEILIECYRLGTGLIEEILNQIADHCGTGLENVEAFIYSYANVMTVNFGRCVMRLDDSDLSSDALTQVRKYKRKIDRRLRYFIQEGIDDGSIMPCDAKIAAFSIAGALNWICHWYEPEGELSAEEIATQFARTLTQGLVAKKKRSGPRLVTNRSFDDRPSERRARKCSSPSVYAELYMGLVETGVELLPGGGGCKEMTVRALDSGGRILCGTISRQSGWRKPPRPR